MSELIELQALVMANAKPKSRNSSHPGLTTTRPISQPFQKKPRRKRAGLWVFREKFLLFQFNFRKWKCLESTRKAEKYHQAQAPLSRKALSLRLPIPFDPNHKIKVIT
jgi:hypothetical protein